jgi:hypothetical protein
MPSLVLSNNMRSSLPLRLYGYHLANYCGLALPQFSTWALLQQRVPSSLNWTGQISRHLLAPRVRRFSYTPGPAAVVDHTQPASKIIQDIEKHGPYREILDTIGVPSVIDIMIRYLSLVDRGTYFTLIPNFNTANLFQRTLTLASSHTYGSWKIRDTKSVGSVSTALWSLKDLLPGLSYLNLLKELVEVSITPSMRWISWMVAL